jgi:hypothetical protein
MCSEIYFESSWLLTHPTHAHHRIIQDDSQFLSIFTEYIVEAELHHIKNVFKLHPSPPAEHNYANYHTDPIHVVLNGYPRFPIDVIVDSPTNHTPRLSAKGIQSARAPIPAIILRPVPPSVRPMPVRLEPSPKRQKQTTTTTTTPPQHPKLGKPSMLFGPTPTLTWSQVLNAVSSRETIQHHPIPVESISSDLPVLPSIASILGEPYSNDVVPNPLFPSQSSPPLQFLGYFNESRLF